MGEVTTVEANANASSETMEFSAVLSRRWDEFLLTGIFSVVELAGLYGGVTQGFAPIVIGALVLFGIMLGGSLYYMLVPAHFIRITPGELTLRSALKTIVIRDSDVEYISSGKTGNSSFLTIKLLSGRQAVARIGAFSERDRITSILAARYRGAESNAIQSALTRCHQFQVVIGTQLLIVLGAMGLFISCAMLSQPARVPPSEALITMAAGTLLIVIPFALPKPYVEVNPDTISRVSMFNTTSIRWDQITSVKLGNIQNHGNVNEWMWVVSGDNKVVAGDETVDDFAFLRDIVLSIVPKEKINDSRNA